MRYKETNWYELLNCEEFDDYTNHKDEECDDCFKVYNQLIEDVNEEMVPIYEEKGYDIMDIYESDNREYPGGRLDIKFCLVLKNCLS